MKKLMIAALGAAVLSTTLHSAPYTNVPKTDRNQKEATASLYFLPNCSHCHKVIAYLNKVKGSVSMKNIDQPQYRQEFKTLGQQGVPVLVVGSQVIAGDQAIISYLSSHPEVMK